MAVTTSKPPLISTDVDARYTHLGWMDPECDVMISHPERNDKPSILRQIKSKTADRLPLG